METFTLVAFIWLGANNSPFHEKRLTSDLGELQCKLLAMQIKQARWQSAWCEIQGRPEPVWSTPPSVDRAPVCADCRTIKERGRAPA